MGDDFLLYLQTEDAARAQFWQLQALARLRREIAKPLPIQTYSELRAALNLAKTARS